MSGAAMALATSSRNFCTMAVGVPGGAQDAVPAGNLIFAQPVSRMVGTSGSAGERLAPVTPIGVTLPVLTCPDMSGMKSNMAVDVSAEQIVECRGRTFVRHDG